MKKLLTMFEDLWVAVAFTEAGEYPDRDTAAASDPAVCPAELVTGG